ncbi:hypothetical protein BH20ACT9_BH20ACT9_12890 [soil metagenome]
MTGDVASRWRALLQALGGSGASGAGPGGPGASGADVRRGRAWASAGRVTGLRVRPGRLTASVQALRATPRAVEVHVAVVGDGQWRAAAGRLAGQAGHLARLLGGRVPEGLDEALAASGAALFPHPKAVRAGCSCERPIPCVHVAAVWEAAARRFEDDPFEYLALRGRGRQRLLAEVAAARSGPAADPDAVDVATLRADGWTRARGPLEDLLGGHEEPPAHPVAAVRVLGDPPSWRGGVSAWDLFGPLIRAAARRAREAG